MNYPELLQCKACQSVWSLPPGQAIVLTQGLGCAACRPDQEHEALSQTDVLILATTQAERDALRGFPHFQGKPVGSTAGDNLARDFAKLAYTLTIGAVLGHMDHAETAVALRSLLNAQDEALRAVVYAEEAP